MWTGKYQGIQVAVKALRMSENDDLGKIKRVSCLSPHWLFLTMGTAIWKGGVGLDAFLAPQRAPVFRYSYYPKIPVVYGFGMDVERERW